MAATPVEMSNSYVFHIDIGLLNLQDRIKVYSEDGRTLVVTYGTNSSRDAFTQRFDLPHNANVDSVSAVSQNGTLFFSVNKFNRPFRVNLVRVIKAEN
ncbi:hypothetical protein MKW94_005006 [Papaver nudicaule]|uniref:SHSP domain-containing protein n=1 Tax=Papaver nudicaule TaxID=74823 RepID=A0AA41SCZ0_PAPNU|nr:hypothetical protein [Papaver nudicaule]